MYTIGKLLTGWEKNRSNEAIDEVILGAEVFLAIGKELKKRT